MCLIIHSSETKSATLHAVTTERTHINNAKAVEGAQSRGQVGALEDGDAVNKKVYMIDTFLYTASSTEYFVDVRSII